MARHETYMQVPWKFKRTTATLSVVAGTTTYTLASDVLKAYLFRYTLSGTERFLRKVDDEIDFYKRIYSASSNRADPLWFYEATDTGSPPLQQIVIYPIPVQNLTVTYNYYRTFGTDVLTTGNLAAQLEGLPAAFHHLIIPRALFYFLTSLDDPKAAMWKGISEKDYSDMAFIDDLNVDNPLSIKLRESKILDY